jgi:hypothetical protein
MKKSILFILLLTAMLGSHAQSPIPVSLKELAPGFGIRPIFLDDTIHVVRYLDSLGGTNPAMTDTCVTINARLMAMENVLLYDYRHQNDTVWVDATHYIEDYAHYTLQIKTLSETVLRRAHQYIEREHIRQDAIQQTALNLRKDSIQRNHRTIVNACEGIGISDKARKKELKDLYYAYLSVYNRYDFSNRRADSLYAASLDRFSLFQQSVISNLLSNNNYTARINNFGNTLKVRCGHNHSDVLRSYQRVFRQAVPPPTFASIREYDEYIASLQNIIDLQNSYLTVIDLREKIAATSKRIVNLYSSSFRDASKTYQEVAATVNTIPAFNTTLDAEIFIDNLNEFIQVQECYLRDYDRLKAIQQHGDSITRNSSPKYSDISKAYKQTREANPIAPKYQTLHDAMRFGYEMDNFETIQRQFDTILAMRQLINSTADSISRGWMSHLVVYNGYQNIRKHYVLTPTFIDVQGGTLFISQLNDYYDMQLNCLRAIKLYDTYRQLGDKIQPDMQSFRNLRKAYSKLDKEYLNIKAVNHLSELYLYIRQLEAIITVQEHFAELLKGTEAHVVDTRLRNFRETEQSEAILGL